jgi:hypothetical protein
MQKPLMRSEMMEITPALAEKWLEMNVDNRTISDVWVEAIARDIADEKWDPNNASLAIIVDNTGKPVKVADGQHRLWAVFKAGRPIWTWVVFGDEENLRRENIDRVRPRSVSDQMQLLFHVAQAKKVAAFCSVLSALEQKRDVGYNEILSLERTLEIRKRHESSLAWYFALLGGGRTSLHRKLMARAPVAGALIYAYPTDSAKIDFFAKQVRDGESLTRTDPAYALRLFLEQSADPTRPTLAANAGRQMVACVALRAIVACLHGERITSLRPGALGAPFYRDACKALAKAQDTPPELPNISRRIAG